MRAHRPPIAEHRLLGDGTTTALVRPDGEIDWWCAPDPDSPPVLWSLLDPHGGASRWVGAARVVEDDRIAGPVLRSTIRDGDGALVRTCDAILDGSIVRLARSIDEPLQLVHERTTRTWGAVDRGTDERVEIKADAREWAGVRIAVTGVAVVADPASVHARITELETRHRRMVGSALLPHAHPDRAADALAVLDACTVHETGAQVASPTTSLPEAPGFDRQFDYRYAWLRDGSQSASVAALLGRHDLAGRHLKFLADLGRHGVLDAPMHTVRGHRVPAEREVPGVAGWADSRPVRDGNAAADQLQYDVLGTVIESVSVHLQCGGRLHQDTWHLVKTFADRAAAPPEPLSSGVWELREPQALVSADIGRWLALDRAIWIAKFRRPWTRRGHWRRARDEARHAVLSQLRPDGSLPQSPGSSRSDATSLWPVIYRLLPADDPRAHRLVDATIAELGDGCHLRRYLPIDDGFDGVEGTFVPCSWWAVSALAALGRVEEAEQRADALCAELPRLLPEEWQGEALGNTPLVWSHAECARAIYLLTSARVEARWGPVGHGAWRLGRLARLVLRRYA